MTNDDIEASVPGQGQQAIPERLNKALIALFAVAIIAIVLFLSYAAIVPAPGEKFTEFYILGPDGKASGYPEKLHLGGNASVIVGIVNHEYKDVDYDLVVTLNRSTNGLYEESVLVAAGQRWEKAIDLRPDRAGADQKLEFLLYADGNYTAPYRDLRLFISVT